MILNAKYTDPNFNTPWGPIGYMVFKRTYARRLKEEDKSSPTEEFWQVIERELEASDTQLKVGFTEEEKFEYARLRQSLKFSVAGRFLWQLGTKTVNRLGLPSLQNCAFTVVDGISAFTWAFEMLMLGSGVGYNIQRHNVYKLPKLKRKIKIERVDEADVDFVVPDNREGWVELLKKVLEAHFITGEGFTYSTIVVRGKGSPIKGFGGVASGPEELCEGINEIHNILNSMSGKQLRPIHCLDIMNNIGSIVVSGNVRRSAQIAIGDYDDIEFLKAKRWDLGGIPNWRAMSNNSIVIPDNFDDLPKEFWDTYENGEAYGLINIELAKKIGRTGETQYADPTVEGFNPCQPEFATVLTKHGVKQFKDISIGAEIWSKEGWTTVTNKWSTGIKPVSAYYSTGGVFVGTSNHKVDTKEGKIEVENAESILTIAGKVCPTWERLPHIIMDGLFLGDGYHKKMIGRDYTYPVLVIGKDDQDYFNSEIKDFIISKFQEDESREDWSVNTSITQVEKAKAWELEIPDRYYLKDERITQSLLRGLYSADGSVIVQSGNSVRVTYKTASKKLSRQIQQMLSSIGIRSYITTNLPKLVEFDNGEYLCKESYDVNITKDVKIFASMIGFIQEYKNTKLNNAIVNYKPNNSDTYTSVKEVEYLGEFEVFDITVDNNSHTYWTGGLSVSNCAEQGLGNRETCCLAEVYLPNISSYDELLKCLIYAYRMCKHSLALHCKLKDTEDIVHKNMRMGIGMTGVLQASEEQLNWLKEAYNFLRDYDISYSEEYGFPVSVKLTTIKPSGTLSLLSEVTPGVHPNPAGPFYIRRVRIASNSPLIEVCKSHGYNIEYVINFDGTTDMTTMVVEFPCRVPSHTPVAKDYTWKQQLDMVRRMQREWSDNSVSCTVYYKLEDLPEIKEYLKQHMKEELKTVSFMRYSEHGFIQAPYEDITEEKYIELASKCYPITKVEVREKDFDVQDCDNGSCPIK